MTIFFSGSVHGRQQYEDNYRKIVSLVEDEGHRVKADHVLEVTSQDIEQYSAKEDEKYLKKIINGIKSADAVFADLSHGSTSVGYYLATAINFGKPVVIFQSGDDESHLLKTLEASSEKVAVVRYETIDDLKREVPLMLDFISEVQDTRFNFFVSPNIISYLDWVSKHRRVPRSVYLRRLIDEDMAENQEYQH